MKWSRDLLLKFWEPLHIPETVESRKFTFWHTGWPLGVQIRKCKIRSKGVVRGSRDLLLEFWDLLHISGTVEARNFKFCTQMATSGPKQKSAKLGQNGP